MNWSDKQQAIFKFVQSGKGNAIVEAVAGSGKTTTIVEALRKARGTALFLAFNKAIADELKSRKVNARTFHSACFSSVVGAKPGRYLDMDKTRKIMNKAFSRDDDFMYGSFVRTLVGLAKQSGISCLIDDTYENWFNIVEHHDLELDHEKAEMPRAVELARQILRLCNAHKSMVDFDDMLYLAVKEDIALAKFDIIFIDEAQDTNAIQRAVLRKMMKTRTITRIVAVGDPAQAIYGFRGADSNSLDRIAKEFKAISLPLTVSYRCPVSVVEYARQWVSHIEPSPTALAGEVLQRGKVWQLSEFQAADLVICRTTRPLIELGYRLLRDRKPFYIMGKEIGTNLKNLILRQKCDSVNELEDSLLIWKNRETEKALARQQETKAGHIADKYEAIHFLIGSLPETARTIDELCHVIDLLFAEKAHATILATIHKAKGLEAENVWWLNSSQCPSAWAKRGWQQEQERNLCYVATTRAKSRLLLIESGE